MKNHQNSFTLYLLFDEVAYFSISLNPSLNLALYFNNNIVIKLK